MLETVLAGGARSFAVACFVLLIVNWPCLAETGPETLRKSAVGMRRLPVGPDAPRGATPRLTVVEHQLRDWVSRGCRD
jgi:hypothetical protein